jgi:inosine/xanthosine triphosphatase
MDVLAIAVASRNPVKLEATRRAFVRAFPEREIRVSGHIVDSGVADQPATDAETLLGAENRAASLTALLPDAHFSVGIEGGIERSERGVEAFAWVVIESAGATGRSRTCSFHLPSAVVELLDAGLELGDANDRVFNTKNSKTEPGAVGILTNGLISRTDLYEPAVVLALIPFLKT